MKVNYLIVQLLCHAERSDLCPACPIEGRVIGVGICTPRETQSAIFAAKRYIEDNLCRELNLMMVTVPLIVDAESGVNDMLDRDGSRTPVQFHISNDYNQHPVDAQVRFLETCQVCVYCRVNRLHLTTLPG